MRIFVDADACPVKQEIERDARKYQVPVTMISDTSHQLKSDYSEIITVDKARDSADLALANRMQKGDLVITQDYGVAALALGRGAQALHPDGFEYNADNIDRLLFERHLGQKSRRAGKHTASMKKRTPAQDEAFCHTLKALLERHSVPAATEKTAGCACHSGTVRGNIGENEAKRWVSMIAELQQKIQALKKEKGITILAHSYQSHDILEIADIQGDSFRLSEAAMEIETDTVIVCGVHFMGETVKILSPEKKVIMANPQAGCPMAEQFTPEFIADFKQKHPDYQIVAYVNTTAALKAECDVCVTSSSAVNIVKKLDAQNILFIPDCNLGGYVKEKVPEKNIELLEGGCPVHAAMTPDDVRKARELHPNALVLVHPECPVEVLAEADFIGSTADIMNYAAASDHKEFIIGTEISIVENLSYRCPDKRFYAMSKNLICPDMKLTTLADVYHALLGDGGAEVVIDPEVRKRARKSIDEMIRLG